MTGRMVHLWLNGILVLDQNPDKEKVVMSLGGDQKASHISPCTPFSISLLFLSLLLFPSPSLPFLPLLLFLSLPFPHHPAIPLSPPLPLFLPPSNSFSLSHSLSFSVCLSLPDSLPLLLRLLLAFSHSLRPTHLPLPPSPSLSLPLSVR